MNTETASGPVHIADSMLKFMRLGIVQLSGLMTEMEEHRTAICDHRNNILRQFRGEWTENVQRVQARIDGMDTDLVAARAALKLLEERGRAGRPGPAGKCPGAHRALLEWQEEMSKKPGPDDDD